MTESNCQDELSSMHQQMYSRQQNTHTFTEKEQQQILQASALIIGSGANASEVIKNLTRNGMSTIYLCDSSKITKRDIRNNYFLNSSVQPKSDLKSKIQLQSQNTSQGDVGDIGKTKDECMSKKSSSVKPIKFNEINKDSVHRLSISSIIVTLVIDWKDIVYLNTLANESKIPFIMSLQMSLSFFIFSDFGSFSYPPASSEPKTVTHIPIHRYFSEELSPKKIKKIVSYSENQKTQQYVLFKTVIEYLQEKRRLPKLNNNKESLEFVKKALNNAETLSLKKFFSPDIILRFALKARLECSYVSELCGAFTATEVLKSIVKRFKPLNQLFCWDNLNLLSLIPTKPERVIKNHHLFDYISLFGSKTMKTISNLKILLVGCGATGCEKLKMLYQMGACSGPQGKLYLVDNDHIEISNIPRQVLFNFGDVKKSKAEVCKNWLKKKDPNMKVEAHTLMINESTQDIFNFQFFENLDLIIAAVDSVEARHYLADKAILHKKFLIESSTKGFGAQSKCQIPILTPKINIALKSDVEISSCTSRGPITDAKHALSYSKTIFTDELSCIRLDTTVQFLKDENLLHFFNKYSDEQNSRDSNDEELLSFIKQLFNRIFKEDVEKIGNSYYPFTYDDGQKDHNQFVQSLFRVLKAAFENSNRIDEQPIKSILPTFDKDDPDHGLLVYLTANLRAKAFNVEFTYEKSDAIGLIGNIIPAVIESTSIASGFCIQELFTWIMNQQQIKQLQNEVQATQLKYKNYADQEEQQHDEDFKNIEKRFQKIGFQESYGQVNFPQSVGRVNIQFQPSEHEFCFELISSNTILSELIKEINDVLMSQNLPQSYTIKLKNELIYVQDAETNQYLNSQRELLIALQQGKLSQIDSFFFQNSTDSIYILDVFDFSLNLKNIKREGPLIAKFKLYLSDVIS